MADTIRFIHEVPHFYEAYLHSSFISIIIELFRILAFQGNRISILSCKRVGPRGWGVPSPDINIIRHM